MYLVALLTDKYVQDALKRAEAYRNAGADAVLIHSNKKESVEIDSTCNVLSCVVFLRSVCRNNVELLAEFMKEWDRRHPVVVVPTNYYHVPTQHLKVR